MKETKVLTGFGIVVLDRGFVYVGEVTFYDGWCLVKNAKNIREWGTTNGLGELAQNGPTAKTKLDVVGTLRAPMSAVIHVIDTEREKWITS